MWSLLVLVHKTKLQPSRIIKLNFESWGGNYWGEGGSWGCEKEAEQGNNKPDAQSMFMFNCRCRRNLFCVIQWKFEYNVMVLNLKRS